MTSVRALAREEQMMRKAFLCVVVLGVAACGGGAGGTAQPSTAPRVRGSSDVITEAEITAAVHYQNALEVVQNLRPSMTVARGIGADATGTLAVTIPVVVYVDNVRLGEIQHLATIPSNRVKEIRYLNSRDATTRYGTGHSSGVILVTTKR